MISKFIMRENKMNKKKNESFQRLMTFFLQQNQKYGGDWGVAGMYNMLNTFYGKGQNE